jgi:hypothetical protein
MPGMGSQNVVFVSEASTYPGNLLQMKILELHPRPTKSGTLYFNKYCL